MINLIFLIFSNLHIQLFMKLVFISWNLKIRTVLYNIILNLNYLCKILILILNLDKKSGLKTSISELILEEIHHIYYPSNH